MVYHEIKIVSKDGTRYGVGDKCVITVDGLHFPVEIKSVYSSLEYCGYEVQAVDIDGCCDYGFLLDDIEDITDIEAEKLRNRK